MKKIYASLAAMAAIVFSQFNANAFTVEEIAGVYNATDMDFSQNTEVFKFASNLSGLESVTWEMTISVIEGNKVKLTNFIKKGINRGNPSKEGVFDIEGVFDPSTNTILINKTEYTYPAPYMSSQAVYTTIARYDGVLEVGETFGGELESFTAKFDSNKTLVIEPWAMYNTNSKKVQCTPCYKRFNKETNGTRFTYVSAGVENIAADENAPVEYFNLQGVKVENPENGLYIRRQGSKVEKVVIR